MVISSVLYRVFIKIKERRFGRKLRYLFFNNHSNSLLVVFSGFSPGDQRKYNYIKSFRSLSIDKLFILDPYAYRGSYYLYEDGSNYPQIETQSLIDKIIKKYNYKRTFFAGSSKGGSAALFFGLNNDATAVFSGACQYNIGTYLNCEKHLDIFNSMMGERDPLEFTRILNFSIRGILKEKKGSETIIYLLYSKQEPTYEEEIIDLLKDLEESNYKVITEEESFIHHGDVGRFFPSFVEKNIKYD